MNNKSSNIWPTNSISPFKNERAPYYIFGADYRENSAGIVALHVLCHSLNQRGYPAYLLNTKQTHPSLDVRLLETANTKLYEHAPLPPITIYPEIVSDNPLNAPIVVRWMLNNDGFLTGKPIKFGGNDLIYYHSNDFVPDTEKNPALLSPLLFSEHLSPPNKDNQRAGALLYIHRIDINEIDLSKLPNDIRILNNNEPLPISELIDLFQKSTVLYSAERSGTCVYAMLSGCPVLYIRSSLLKAIPEQETFGDACAWIDDHAGFENARQNISRAWVEVQKLADNFETQLSKFIADTQTASFNYKAPPHPSMPISHNGDTLCILQPAPELQNLIRNSITDDSNGPPPNSTPLDFKENSEMAILEAGKSYLNTGDLESAFTCFQNLVEAGSQLWQPYLEIAHIALAQNEIAIAKDFFEQAISREYPAGYAHRECAKFLIATGDGETALAALSPLLRSRVDDFDALYLARKAVSIINEISPVAWARLVADLRYASPLTVTNGIKIEKLQHTPICPQTAQSDTPSLPANGPPSFCFPDSRLAHHLLDGKQGIEIGAAHHNPFHIPGCLFVDKWMDSEYKKKEIELSGKCQEIHVLAEGNTLPFRNDSLDYILTSHVLEHFYDPIGALKEWYRVVKNGGLIFTIFPHKERTFDSPRKRTTLAELLERHDSGIREASDAHHTVWVTQDAIELVTHLGWKINTVMDHDDKVGNGFTFVIEVQK